MQRELLPEYSINKDCVDSRPGCIHWPMDKYLPDRASSGNESSRIRYNDHFPESIPKNCCNKQCCNKINNKELRHLSCRKEGGGFPLKSTLTSLARYCISKVGVLPDIPALLDEGHQANLLYLLTSLVRRLYDRRTGRPPPDNPSINKTLAIASQTWSKLKAGS
jgi:hypothetical protein